MGVMPGHIAKGVILEKFDDFINAKRANLIAALNEYKTGPDIWKAIDWGRQPARGILAQADVNHVVNHWFPEHQALLPPNAAGGSPFWNTMRPLGPILRQGLITALTLCDQTDLTSGVPRSAPLPLDSYWICTQTHFEICVTIGYAFDAGGTRQPDHVNLLILTPNPPIPRHHTPSGGFTGDEDIWVVQHSAIEPGATPIGAPSAGPIVTVRLMK